VAVEKVGRAEHGKDMVERIQVVRWRNRERGLKEGTRRPRGGWRRRRRCWKNIAERCERNTIVRARDPFLDGESTELPERERNRQKEALPSPASNIKREIYARTSAELRKTLFSTDRKRVSRFARPRSPVLVASAPGTSASINPRSTGYVKRRV